MRLEVPAGKDGYFVNQKAKHFARLTLNALK